MRATSFPISDRHATLVSAQLTMAHMDGAISESEFMTLVHDLRDAWQLSRRARKLRGECPREAAESLLNDALAGNLRDDLVGDACDSSAWKGVLVG